MGCEPCNQELLEIVLICHPKGKGYFAAVIPAGRNDLERDFKRVGLLLHWKKKWSHLDLKSCVTGGTNIRESNCQFDSQYRINWTQIISNYSQSRVEFYFQQWLNFLGQNDSIFFFQCRADKKVMPFIFFWKN